MGHSLSHKILFDVQVAEMQDKSHKSSYGLDIKVQATNDCWLGCEFEFYVEKWRVASVRLSAETDYDENSFSRIAVTVKLWQDIYCGFVL